LSTSVRNFIPCNAFWSFGRQEMCFTSRWRFKEVQGKKKEKLNKSLKSTSHTFLRKTYC